jgi:hypothetical protein
VRWHDVPRGTMNEARSHVRLDLPSVDGKADQKIVPPRSRTPCWKGPGADSEEKHEPVSDTDAVLVDSLKALDPNRPIREADITCNSIDREPQTVNSNRWKPKGQAVTTRLPDCGHVHE